MTIDQFTQCYPDVEITPEQLHASRFLEKQGSLFLIDHGYVDAPLKAWDIIDPEGFSRTYLEYAENKLNTHRFFKIEERGICY